MRREEFLLDTGVSFATIVNKYLRQGWRVDPQSINMIVSSEGRIVTCLIVYKEEDETNG